MKLLFDQNLSPGLVGQMADVFPGSVHVFLLGLDQSDDLEIARFAVNSDFVIVTKDADYSEMVALKDQLPKIIWIRKGNCSTAAIEKLLREHFEQINALSEHDNVRLLMLF